MERPITLGEFIVENQNDFAYASNELSALLSSIRLAGKVVNQQINKAGLSNILGKNNVINAQGEAQTKLDDMANQVFVETLRNRGEVCGLVSEELDDEVIFDDPIHKNANYIVLIDPLDGSSNIDVNVTVGTIFSIYRRISKIGSPITKEDFLQPGINQVAAGYLIYGSSTILVYSTGNGVNGFTFDPGIGSFFLSHPNITFPKTGRIYSINEGNYELFPTGIKRFIKWAQEVDEKDGRPLSARYTGSMVADVHRNMLRGGIYLYPQGTKSPSGKLRLLYEANPMAFLTEQANGRASNGVDRILEIKPESIHQRCPFVCGSPFLVKRAEELMAASE